MLDSKIPSIKYENNLQYTQGCLSLLSIILSAFSAKLQIQKISDITQWFEFELRSAILACSTMGSASARLQPLPEGGHSWLDGLTEKLKNAPLGPRSKSRQLPQTKHTSNINGGADHDGNYGNGPIGGPSLGGQ